MSREEQIKLAAKLYKMRDSAKMLYGNDYLNKIADYKRFIKACMLKHNYNNELNAAMRLANDAKDVDDSGVGTMNIFAACIELIEENQQ